MAFNGSGTFLINTAGQPVVSGTVISSTAFNALTADLATGLSTVITKDGQTTVTANIPMSTYKFTGLGVGSAATDSANLSQVQSTVTKLLTSVSGADTITAVGAPVVAAYAAGQMFYFVATGDNTGAVTLNIDSLGAKAVTRDGSVALAAGDIKSGEVVVVVYDGTRFQVVSQLNSAGDARFANVSIASSLYVGGVSTFVGNAGFSANVSIASALSVGGVAAITGATTIGGNLTLSGGTANGVLYLNGSKVATSGTALAFDGTNFGVGTAGNAINHRSVIYFGGVNAVYQMIANGNTGLGATNGLRIGLTAAGVGELYSPTALVTYIDNSERLRLDSSGNLGIGTSSPASKFQVKVATNANAAFNDISGVARLDFYNDAASANVNANIQFNNLFFRANGTIVSTLDSSGNLGLGVTPSASTIPQFEGGSNLLLTGRGNSYLSNNVTYNGGWKYIATAVAAQYNISGAEHRFYNAPSGTAGNTISWTQAMTLDASGNLGIGTTSPGYRLHVAQASGNDIGFFGTSAGGGGRIAFSDGNSGTAASVPRIGANGNDLLFYTNTSGSNATERARITSGGKLLVGTTTAGYGLFSAQRVTINPDSDGIVVAPLSQNLSAYTVQANNDTGTRYAMYIANGSSTAVGTVSFTSTATAYNTSSDYRLKNTIAPMTGALAKVALLKPCTYKWNVDGSDGQGFIAHELAEVVPQCVTGEKDAVDAEGKPRYQGVDTSFLVATLTAAIQELTARVAQLESK